MKSAVNEGCETGMVGSFRRGIQDCMHTWTHSCIISAGRIEPGKEKARRPWLGTSGA